MLRPTPLSVAHDPAPYAKWGFFKLVVRVSVLMPMSRAFKRFSRSYLDYADAALVLTHVRY
jgi:hypothetical protein